MAGHAAAGRADRSELQTKRPASPLTSAGVKIRGSMAYFFKQAAEIAAILRRRARGVRDVAPVFAEDPREVFALERLDGRALQNLERSPRPRRRWRRASDRPGRGRVVDVDRSPGAT